MANLTITELTRDGKEARAYIFAEKVFSSDRSSEFATDNGLFTAHTITVGSKEYKGTKTKKQIKEIGDAILDLKDAPRGQKTLQITGKYVGKQNSQTLPVTSLIKSEEFGGQPPGGDKENKGIKFEKDLEADLVTILNGKKATGPYASQAKKIIDACSKKIGSPATKVIPMGALNQKRPIASAGDQLYISPKEHSKHGEKLTDITLEHANGKLSYLSLKFSSTLTFMNAGVGTAFPADQMKAKKIKTPMGKAIIKTFGLDEKMFCDVFNEYGTGKRFPTVNAKIDAMKLKKFLQSAIGSGYWMVHGMEGNRIYFWEMSGRLNPQFANVTGSVEIQYGGKQGNGKRIDIVFSNSYYDFKINIRNKQSGTYPSHIMCDYKSKPATGKELL